MFTPAEARAAVWHNFTPRSARGGTDTVRVGSDGSLKAELGMSNTDVYCEKQATFLLTLP